MKLNRWNAIVLGLVIASAVVWVNLPMKPAQADIPTTSNFSGQYQLVIRYDNAQGGYRYSIFDSSSGQFTQTSNVPVVLNPVYSAIPNAKGGCFILDTVDGTVWMIDAKGSPSKVELPGQ